MAPLPEGATIGILGGGQLGRMLTVAAAELGFKCHIYAPKGDNPAFDISAAQTEAAYDDTEALAKFARSVDVITYEFENIPLNCVQLLADAGTLFPPPKALQVSQDRLLEKEFLQGIGIDVAPFAAVDTDDDLAAALTSVGPRGILKTRRFGYDGKGQHRLDFSQESTRPAIPDDLAGPLVYEQLIDFDREISAIVARDADGNCIAFPCSENQHRDGILRTTLVPAHVCPLTSTAAVKTAMKIAENLDYRGVLAVEYFVCEPAQGGVDTLYVNEIAPRVHNSGHWTQDGCDTSQFEQHIRAVAGWPLGSVRRHSDVKMLNLLGEDQSRLAELRALPEARLHLYGKSGWRAGRKMGHANLLSPKT